MRERVCIWLIVGKNLSEQPKQESKQANESSQ
jgi:hypothetical protein